MFENVPSVILTDWFGFEATFTTPENLPSAVPSETLVKVMVCELMP